MNFIRVHFSTFPNSGNIITENHATIEGGGVYVSNSIVTIIANTISRNSVYGGNGSHGGGLCIVGDSAHVANNTITGNSLVAKASEAPYASAHSAGGGVYVEGDSGYISDNTISGNSVTADCISWWWDADAYGGGVYVNGGPAYVRNNIITANSLNASATSAQNDPLVYANAAGGGVYIGGVHSWYAIESAYLDGNLISGNSVTASATGGGGTSALGGGLFINAESADVIDNTISTNSISAADSGAGGGMYISAESADVIDNTISTNSISAADWGAGGGMCINAESRVWRNTLTNNSASGNGGGICTYGQGDIKGNTITGNSAAQDGGGFFISGALSNIAYNDIANNSISGNGRGGGISTSTQLNMNYTNIHNNTPYDLYNSASQNIEVTNNWWGTADEAVIQAHIYDWSDDSSLGKVIFSPYLASEVTDLTPPTTPVVTDDGSYTNNNTCLHATWSASDAESGIVDYQYAIGTSSGGTNVVNWTSVGIDTGITKTGLNLTWGSAYYFSVKAKNGWQNWGEVGISDGITVRDDTPPTTPIVTDDGSYTANTTQLHATWGSSDSESGIAQYQYAIGTSPGGTNVVNWTSVGINTQVTRSGLSLTLGVTYYFAVKAKNGQGLWSEVGVSDGITVGTVTIDLSSGWDAKDLFVPIYYRSPDVTGDVVLGVHNKRDMWYLVKVYKRQSGQPWEEYHPQEWRLPYLAPWSEKTFSYTTNPGEEIKFEVWNDLNDENLTALWITDFATRALLGVSISPEVTNPEEFMVELLTFYNGYLQIGAYLGSGQVDQAVFKIGQTFLTPLAQQALYHLLADQGIAISTAKIASSAVGISFYFLVNAPKWYDLLMNTNKEPFMEDVVFTAKAKTLAVTPNIRVTKSLEIVDEKPYYSGETITAKFTVANRGTAPATLNVLTAGGRGPKGDADVQDFTFKPSITLNPGESYDYEGELKLLDSGSYHFFVACQTPDGEWNTSIPVEGTATNTLDIDVNPIPDNWLAAQLCSPGELRVFDTQDRVTGLVDGTAKNEIPHSVCCGNIVVVLAPDDTYTYQVMGTGEGSYGLTVTSVVGEEITTFNATDIPTLAGAIHQYTIDWDALSRGEKGVTVRIDSDGDGKFEKTVNAGNELTHDDFVSATSKGGLPFWIWIVIGVGALAIVGIVIMIWMRLAKRTQTHGQV